MASSKKKHSVVSKGIIYIKPTFNNTLITITSQIGDSLLQGAAGTVGFKHSRKSTPHAAQLLAEKLGKDAMEKFKMNSVDIIIRDVGPGRENAIRAFKDLGFKIGLIVDETRIPHNGCRPPKKRRV